MREPPALTDSAIIAALHTHFGIAATMLAFLPLGDDSASSAFRAEANGVAYFVKLRTDQGFSAPSLAVPHHLHGQGIPHILAPLQTLTQALWVNMDRFALSVYPFIDSAPAAEVGLSEQQWGELGATLRRIHVAALTPALAQMLNHETYVPSRWSLIPDLQTAIHRADLVSPAQRELAEFWHERSDIIDRLLARSDSLANQLRQDNLSFVLCHADLHTWNVLVDKGGQLWIVDWDEIILAPKERDLMFVVGGIGRNLVSPRESACFLRGYGDDVIDFTLLTHYRYAWAAQDLAAYGERVYFMPDLSEHARREAVRGIMSLFEPGNIVDIAFASQG